MTQALQTLLELAERQRNAALAALMQAEAGLLRLQLQAEQLHTYRDEVRQRHPALGGRSAAIELLRVHQGFLQRLDQALMQQQSHLDAAVLRNAALRAELLALETRVAAVRKLQDRRGAEQQRVATRQEQRRSDDAPRRHADSAAAPLWRSPAAALPANPNR